MKNEYEVVLQDSMLIRIIFTIHVQRSYMKMTQIKNTVCENVIMKEIYFALLILKNSYVGLKLTRKDLFIFYSLLLIHKCLSWTPI